MAEMFLERKVPKNWNFKERKLSSKGTVQRERNYEIERGLSAEREL